MMEKALRDFLLAELDDIAVYLQIPSNPASEYVSIELTGRDEESFIETGTFAVQCWGNTRLEASQLAEEVKDLLRFSLITEEGISGVDITSGPYDFTDTTTKKFRYQIVCDVTFF